MVTAMPLIGIRTIRRFALLALMPAVVQALYLREKIPWQSRVAESDFVEVDTARGWSGNVIWVDARPSDEFERDRLGRACG